MKTVSIIIPCYNSEKHISNAIESAIGQNYDNKEVIVVDDGSSDKSLLIIKKFAKYIQYTSIKNSGACFARNLGAQISKGEYLQFLDADDMLTFDCVAEKIEVSQNKNRLVCSRVEPMFGANRDRMSCSWFEKSYSLPMLILQGGPPTSAPLHHRDLFIRVGGFKTGLPCAQEYDLHLRLAMWSGCTFHVIDHVGVLIRTPETSLSRSGKAKWADAFKRSLLDLLDGPCANLLNEPGVKDALAQKLAMTGRALLREGRVAEANDVFSHARQLSRNWHSGVYRYPALGAMATYFGPYFVETAHAAVKKLLKNLP